MKYFTALVLILVLNSCNRNQSKNLEYFDIQGHRGCRGLMPENSLPAIQRALELKVNTLEIDVVISKDHQVLLSHEPFMSSEICLDLNGSDILHDSTKSLNIYKMAYEEIKQYDCGSKGNERFPDQKPICTNKPLLREIINEAKIYSSESKTDLVNFNIEIKSRPEWDAVFHPEVNVYSDLVMQE